MQPCSGLRVGDVKADAADGFAELCRVVDTGFSRVTAEVLFKIRAAATDVEAVVAFNKLVGPHWAMLFERAVTLEHGGLLCAGFGALAMADMPLAQALVAEAESVQQARGGLYEGRLDHLRSTIEVPLATAVAARCLCCFVLKARPQP